jgi:phosphoribosylamine--glycine ligase
MITPDGPKVVEFNCRFGDPETQAVLPRLQTDIVDIFEACLDGKLAAQNIEWSEAAAVCVVLAADGYPGQYTNGQEISGLAAAAALPDAYIFQAGTAKQDGKLITNGGRVLGVTALGADIKMAIKNAYKAADLISFSGLHKRKDIGKKALAYLK